ncbi:MAG: hypothetical protein LBD90_00660 [Bifidobacteriaceae bacterium]|nr:hypothetical protein [Bifidobacteriaceae bacterium]
MNRPDAIVRVEALTPRDRGGHQFAFYSDSCSGEAADPTGNARRFTEVNAVAQALDPAPEFIAFPGDAVADGSQREQWERWLGVEMAWVRQRGLRLYQATSNHNTPSPQAYALYREFWADLPQNGPAGQGGLAYWERRGNLLYVSLHQPDVAAEPGSTPLTGLSPAEAAWLDAVLAANADCDHQLVAGHYPVWPVNGHTSAPWCFEPAARASLWDILTRHRVTAYLCSHVLAFDAQVRQGVLQLTSGGAAGGDPASPGLAAIPFGMMPGPLEYPHLVQLAVDAQGLRLRVHDAAGQVRERLAWPLSPAGAWLDESAAWDGGSVADVRYVQLAERGDLGALVGAGLRPGPGADEIDWAAAPDGSLRIGFDSLTRRLRVSLTLAGAGPRRWLGPELDLAWPQSVELAFHPDLGPGGVLWREPDGRWSSCDSTSPAGLEAFAWPDGISPTSDLVRLRSALARPTDPPPERN